MIPQNLRDLLEKQQYRIVGNHSAVKICHWTKESLREKGFCYKQKFYGIQTHRCLQMTPTVAWCNQSCVYCWRPIEKTIGVNMDNVELDEPADIIDGCIEAQRALLMGFKGREGINMKLFEEAMEPTQAAISLSGEPALYPKLPGLIEEFHKRNFTTFLVTNGTVPEMLEKIPEPTNLYISIDSPVKADYLKIDRPMIKGTWEDLNKSLSLLQSFRCNTVARVTLMRDTMKNPIEMGKFLEKYKPTFIECKAYMHVGCSKNRVKREQMPEHNEIMVYATEIENNTEYTLKDSKQESRVALLSLK
jgi:tRNA wybutosine-synthesizing protein 1